jgi:SAM-dependent methyltransferase
MGIILPDKIKGVGASEVPFKAAADAFGNLLWDTYNGASVAEIIERDDGNLVASADCRAYFSSFKDWSAEERAAIRFARGLVLDVGCGAGRAALYLQEQGLKVVAMDASPLAVKVCRSRGVKKALVLPFESVGKLAPLRFETILMFGNNFGLFGSAAKARRLMKILRQVSSEHAVIIATTRDTDLSEHKEYHRANTKRGRMAGQLTLRVRYKNLIGPWFDYLFVSPGELKRLLVGTGWSIRKVFRSEQKPEYAVVLEKRR